MITPTATVRDSGDGANLHAMAKRQTKAPPLIAGNTDERALFLQGREALRRAINDRGIYRVPPGSHELWSLENNDRYYDDKFYIWQFYLRAPLLEPQHLLFIARCFWSGYRERYQQRQFQIAGVEQASLPILTAILMTAASVGITNLTAFTVRKERKKFGLKNIIEGAPNPDLPVVFIDDLTSSGHATFWHFIRTIKEARIQPYLRAFVVVHKAKRAEIKDIATTMGNVRIYSIFTLEDFDMTYEEYHANRIATETT